MAARSIALFCLAMAPSASAQEMFGQAYPYLDLMQGESGNTFSPLTNPATGGTTFPYAPAQDIANPLLNAESRSDAVPHDYQVLSIYWPYSPAMGERFPTLFYCTAGPFSESTGIPNVVPTFLETALGDGWCVVTVGGVGSNSQPTSTQIQRCIEVGGTSTNPPPCWDYNLWYPPDDVTEPSPSPWNDFNYFYGEKDMVWARQWIAEHAATYHIDNDRIVVSGLSTGAIYTSFLAYQPNRAWVGQNYSSQSQRDTRVAAFVSWDQPVWMPALLIPLHPAAFTGLAT